MASAEKNRAFINLPFRPDYERLYLAYIAALCGHGLIPRAAFGIPGSARRLDRIHAILDECSYSFHDLSWIGVEGRSRTPRFNMPFELGLVVESARHRDHQWFVFERTQYRIQKSLSDLNGTECYIHRGTAAGLLSACSNALARTHHRPTATDLKEILGDLRRAAKKIRRDLRSATLFDTRPFDELVAVALRSAEHRIATLKPSPLG
jgi:hypothetical protein